MNYPDDFDDENPMADLGVTDADIEDPSYFESIKSLHFASGVSVVYAASDDVDEEMYVIEYPDGRKVVSHVSDLWKHPVK